MEITEKVLKILLDALWKAYREGLLTDNEMQQAIFAFATVTEKKDK